MTGLSVPYIERYGYTWIQHPDGLYDGPLYPREDEPLIFLERNGKIGHASVRRGGVSLFPAPPRSGEEEAA